MTGREREADDRQEEEEEPADEAELPPEDGDASEELFDQEPGSAAPGDPPW